VKLVLHHGIEGLRDLKPRVIVHAALGKDVGDLLVDTALAGTDRTDPLQKFLKIVFAEDSFALLKALIVQYEPFSDVFLENLRSPNTELGSPL
jgi:hypothetical protein